MPRLVFHIKQHNKWSVFVQYYNNKYHIFGRRSFNQNTTFHTTISGQHTSLLYLEEILDYNSNRPDYSITLFYSDLLEDSPFSEFETYTNDRMKEVIGYDYIRLYESKLLKYLEFVLQNVYIESGSGSVEH